MPLGIGSSTSRRRGSLQQAPPANSSASIAAVSAFRKSNAASPSLSSAAAAAALRSHTTSPEPVANLQTRRMIRRSSQSSTASGPVNGKPTTANTAKPLQRRSSSSSMTERTFRSPSPAGGLSPIRAAVPAAIDAPPVPALSTTAHSRTSSLDRQPENSASSISKGPKLSPLRTSTSSDRARTRTDSEERARLSVNFSRPMASPTPPVSPTSTKPASSWFASPAETGAASRHSDNIKLSASPKLSPGESSGIEETVKTASRTSSMKGKNGPSTEGSLLAQKTMNDTAPRGSAVQEVSDKQPNNKVKQVSDKPAANKQRTAERSDDSPRRPSGLLHKQPSVVMEEPENEQESAKAEGSTSKTRGDTANPTSASAKRLSTRPRAAVPAALTSSTGSPLPRTRHASLEVPDGYTKTTHFGADDSEVVRHEPPPRSVSPAKSALKHSPSSSIRTSSPATNFSPLAKPPGSDTSDTMSLASQDLRSETKRKSRRVSFDDNANKTIPSEQENIRVNNRKKDARQPLSPGASDDEFEDLMKPRPALPSFGSVRNPPVRHNERNVAEKAAEKISTRSQGTDGTLQGVSNDHAVGGILRQHQEQKPSRNDPVPPEVTSVETPANLSDIGESSEDEARGEAAPAGKDSSVPDINILPATPAIEEAPIDSSSEPVGPGTPKSARSTSGGWGNVDEAFSKGAASGSAKNQPTSSAADHADDYYSDSDDSAAFSDAAEDPSELEPFGFASLDAIVESPVAPERKRQPPDELSPTMSTPLLDSSPEIAASGRSETDWSSTSAHWSKHKQQLQARDSERQSKPSTDRSGSNAQQSRVGDDGRSDEVTSNAKPRTTRNDVAKSQASKVPATNIARQASLQAAKQPNGSRPQDRPLKSSMKQTPASANSEKPDAMRKSMRGAPPPAVARSKDMQGQRTTSPPTTMRKSMRGPPEQRPTSPSVSMRSTMRGPPEPRPSSPPVSIRSTMRGPPEPRPSSPPVSMRSSMRSAPVQRPTSPPISMRSSMRGAPEKRPTSPPVTMRTSMRGAPVQRSSSVQPTLTNGSTRAKAPLASLGNATGDSDSESSFKRKRTRRSASVDLAGHHSIRRSMRSPTPDRESERRPFSSEGPSKSGSSRWSLRSLSPSRQSVTSPAAIRSSLRGTSISENTTSVSSKPPKSSSRFSMSGFSKGAKAAPPPPPAAKQNDTRPRFKSRFADSDSEDDAVYNKTAGPSRRLGFTSRFKDSDDEDELPSRASPELRPVRGIPRRKDDIAEESTDLDDSSDEEARRRRAGKTKKNRTAVQPLVPSPTDIEKAMATARQNVAAMTGNQGLLQDPNEQKKDDLSSRPAVAPTSGGNAADAGDVGVARGRSLLGSMFRRRSSSVVRREEQTPRMKQPPAPPATIHEASPPQSPAGGRGGKLQRRKGASRTNSTTTIGTVNTIATVDSQAPPMPSLKEYNKKGEGDAAEHEWPLPPPPTIPAAIDAAARPASVDGVPASAKARLAASRPEVAQRSQSGVFTGKKDANGNTVYSEKTGKKKRFGMLRRAFGLHD